MIFHSLSFLLFLQSRAFPKFTTEVAWPSPTTSLTSNTPFQVTASFEFPSWVTRKSFHPLAIDNPGPRADSILVQLSLAYVNGTPIRMMFEEEMEAADGPWYPSVDFLLPSYVLSDSHESEEFVFQVVLANLDQLMDVLSSWVTKAISPPFKLRKYSLADGEPKVADSVFLRHGDGKEGKTVSLYYGMRSTRIGPQKLLIKSIFHGTEEYTSLESF